MRLSHCLATLEEDRQQGQNKPKLRLIMDRTMILALRELSRRSTGQKNPKLRLCTVNLICLLWTLLSVSRLEKVRFSLSEKKTKKLWSLLLPEDGAIQTELNHGRSAHFE